MTLPMKDLTETAFLILVNQWFQHGSPLVAVLSSVVVSCSNSFYPHLLDCGFTCYVPTIVPGAFTCVSHVIFQQSYGNGIVNSILSKG